MVLFWSKAILAWFSSAHDSNFRCSPLSQTCWLNCCCLTLTHNSWWLLRVINFSKTIIFAYLNLATTLWSVLWLVCLLSCLAVILPWTVLVFSHTLATKIGSEVIVLLQCTLSAELCNMITGKLIGKDAGSVGGLSSTCKPDSGHASKDVPDGEVLNIMQDQEEHSGKNSCTDCSLMIVYSSLKIYWNLGFSVHNVSTCMHTCVFMLVNAHMYMCM